MPLMSQSYFSKCPEKGPISTSMCPIHVVTMLLYGSGLSRLSFEDVSEGLVHICLMRYLCCSKNTSLCFPMLTKKKRLPPTPSFPSWILLSGIQFKKKNDHPRWGRWPRRYHSNVTRSAPQSSRCWLLCWGLSAPAQHPSDGKERRNSKSWENAHKKNRQNEAFFERNWNGNSLKLGVISQSCFFPRWFLMRKMKEVEACILAGWT